MHEYVYMLELAANLTLIEPRLEHWLVYSGTGGFICEHSVFHLIYLKLESFPHMLHYWTVSFLKALHASCLSELSLKALNCAESSKITILFPHLAIFCQHPVFKTVSTIIDVYILFL